MNPIAVFRYAGDGPHGLAQRFGDSLTPHTIDAERVARAEAQGWTQLMHRPLGETNRPGMSADTPSTQPIEIVNDLIANAKPNWWFYWGSPYSAHMQALLESDPAEYASRLMRAALLMKRLGGVHVLDHSTEYDIGGSPASVFASMVSLHGCRWTTEPWNDRGGFCLERWYYRDLLTGGPPPVTTRYSVAVRWWSGHTLEDGSLPWSGNVRHWLQHVEAHGHTPAMNIEDIDLSVTATEFLDSIRKGTR